MSENRGARVSLKIASGHVPSKSRGLRRVAQRTSGQGSSRRPASRSATAETAAPAIEPATSLGIDLGAYYSKATVDVRLEGGGLKIFRVPFELPRSHPQYSSAPRSRPYEFPALAALLTNGNVHVGHLATQEDLTIGLKMMMMYCAGITCEETLLELPGAKKFLPVVRSGEITVEKMEKAIYEHLDLIREVAVNHMDNADKLQQYLMHIVLTYPNFLGQSQHKDDFAKYRIYITNQVRGVMDKLKLDHPVQYHMVSEGQGALIYMLEQFADPAHHSNRRQRYNFLSHAKDGGRNVLLADWGSSSLNLQVQNVYYDSNGRLARVQSSFGRGWLTGTKGGSNISNDEVRQFIEEYLGHEELRKLPPGEIATYVQDWEQKKQSIDYRDYIRSRNQITLHGTGAGPSITVEAEELVPFFHKAFNGGLAELEREIDFLIELGRDFDLVFLGGSLNNPGLRTTVESLAIRKGDQARASGITNTDHLFLVDGETYTYSSAVSAGAALSVLNVPPPLEVLGDSAIGVQVATPDLNDNADESDDLDSDDWTGDNKADILFVRDSQVSFTCRDDSRNYPGGKATFKLVCDPNYAPNHRANKWLYPPIQIGNPLEVLNGRFATYDLGWSIELAELPTGNIQFKLEGREISLLTMNMYDPELMSGPIPFMLSCYGLDEEGAMQPSEHDRRWSLVLETGPETKLLVLKEQCRLPVWCSNCRKDLRGETKVCKTCREREDNEVALCDNCQINLPRHPRGHEWETVKITL